MMADWGQRRKGHTTQDKLEWGLQSVCLYLCVSSLAQAFLWATGPTLVYETGKEITN